VKNNMANGDQTQVPAPVPTGGDQALQAASQQTAQPGTGLPAPVPNMPNRTTSASGLIPILMMNIQNAYANHKEAKIKQAMGMYMGLQGAHERAQQVAQASGETDPTKIQQMTAQVFSKDPVVQETFNGKQGEKNVKAMKELLNIDLTDPESMNTVQHQALSRVVKATGARQLVTMIGNAIHAHKAQSQQSQPGIPGTTGTTPPMGVPPPQPSQAAAAATSLEQRAVPRGVDVKSATDIAKSEADLTNARAALTRSQQEYRDKYDIRPDKDGNIVAIDKTDPTKVVRVTDQKGDPVTSQTKAGAAPKVAMVENVPYGVVREGKTVTPDSKEWTAEDARVFEAAKAASATGEANKTKLADKRATFFSSLPQAVMSKVDDPAKGIKAGELAFVTRQEAGANPAKYAPVGSGDKALGTQARFGEIQRTVDMTNQAIANLPDTGFDAKARAQIAYVLRSPDPASALDGFFKSGAATTLTDAQIDYVTSLSSLAESAQAMTSLQGIGARGSDKLRSAIVAMLPGAGTPSRKYATMQMSKFQVELDALRKGVPSLGGLSGDGTKPARSKTDPLGLGF
jgi:hypothetical protein